MKIHVPPYLLWRDILHSCELRTADMRLIEEMIERPEREIRR